MHASVGARVCMWEEASYSVVAISVINRIDKVSVLPIGLAVEVNYILRPRASKYSGPPTNVCNIFDIVIGRFYRYCHNAL